ncbi:MAG: recombinase family protein [bacterium]|nr:recombinase family protein [bacterium]
MTTAAIYARVSSDRQKDDHTIESQTTALRDHAERTELEVPPEWVFEDEGHSGATLLRPALERLRDLAVQIHIDVVLCYSPDRLARKYAYQALLIEEFARIGTEVRFVKGPKGDTPEDQLLLQFQGMIAEYERAQIAERTRRGKIHRARSGSVSVLSCAPYGYRYVRKTDEEDARYDVVMNQAAVVREVFKRYVEDQESIGALTRWLTDEGILTATGKTRWDRSTVWGMLRNPAYRGRAGFGKTRRIGEQACVTRRVRMQGRGSAQRPATRDRARDEWIEIPVPAIVSDETFELAGRRLQDNKRFASRRTKEPSLLQGLLVCQSCGYSYYRSSTKTSARKIYYYRCIGSDNYRFEQGRVCDNRPVRQDSLDQKIWDHVTTLLADPNLIRRELDRRLEKLRRQSPATAERSRLELDLTRATKAKARLTDAYQEGLLELDELRERMPNLQRSETSLRGQLEALERGLVDEQAYLTLAENLQNFVSRLRSSAETSSIAERQKVLRLVVKQVLVGLDSIVIRHTVPSSNPDPPLGCLLRGRRHDPALRRTRLRVHCAPSVLHTRIQPLADQAQQHAVTHPPTDQVPERGMYQGVEEALDVNFQHPASAHQSRPFSQRR